MSGREGSISTVVAQLGAGTSQGRLLGKSDTCLPGEERLKGNARSYRLLSAFHCVSGAGKQKAAREAKQEIAYSCGVESSEQFNPRYPHSWK